MVRTRSRLLETRVKLVRCSPIKNDLFTDRSFKIRDKVISGPSVDKFVTDHKGPISTHDLNLADFVTY